MSNHRCIPFIEQDIINFMACYRASFPQATVVRKMHILEDHVIVWFQWWHLGLGLMGEQGADAQLEITYQGIYSK